MISVVDTRERIDVLLPVLDKMIVSGIATITNSERRQSGAAT
jgi:PII-like signaling protein